MSGKVGDLTRLIGLISAQGDTNTAKGVSDRDAGLNLQQGGLQELVFPNLAQIGPTGQVNEFTYSSNGTFLYLAKSGTSPGAEFQVSFVGEKSLTSITPGSKIVGNFKGFRLVNRGLNSQDGRARFVIGQNPGVNYEEWDLESWGALFDNSLGVGTAWNLSAVQAYNAVNGGANIPFNTGNGRPRTTTNGGTNTTAISLRGAKSFRAMIIANSEISTCKLRWWFYDLISLNWYPSQLIETLIPSPGNAESRFIMSTEHEVGIRYGFAQPEIYENTNVGNTDFRYFCQVL